MPRTKGGTVTRKRRKKILKLAKGYRGAKHLQFKAASTQLFVSRKYAFRDRKKVKSEFRRLWIARINAAARLNGMSYSRFMAGLKSLGILLDRKVLADMALNQAQDFANLVEMVKNK